MRKIIALGLVVAFSLAVISPLLAQEKIDLNKASAARIATLRGVSQQSAAAIVAERVKGGPYVSKSDCAKRVQGLDRDTTDKWDSVECKLRAAKSEHPK